MILSTRGIVFHTLKYSETSVIAKVFTREMGLLSFIIPGVRSKSGRIRASHLMPLNLLELVISYRAQSGLQRVKELRCSPVLSHIQGNMTKTSIAMFMREILNHAIREEEKNESLFDFLASSIQVLDLTESSLSLFPNHFLVQLSRHLGFFPDPTSYQDGHIFDWQEGSFITPSMQHKQCSDADNSKMIRALIAANYDAVCEIKVPNASRRQTLQDLLDYYRIHLHDFRELKSPAILGEVLSA